MECLSHIEIIKEDFAKSRKLLNAIGDETRQNIVTALMGTGCNGIRVGEITKRTHLSRPAVSHHMKILLGCGIVKVLKQGTMNFYSLNIGEEFEDLFMLVKHLAAFKNAKEAGAFQ
jgi:ArsR family transcriptional regulator